MTTCSYSIEGGDYEHAGTASRSLKELLKTVGVDSHAVRRVMIAAYEAEMNVVIHAHRGTLVASVDDRGVRVEVIDEGPGIPDISLAMKEGYSTAPPKARALGFGAGLGLPNIRKHSDTFRITSDVGKGTQVLFEIACRSEEGLEPRVNSMALRGELCRECLRCVHVCPTQAMRLLRGAPHLIMHLCVECTACIERCSVGALSMEAVAALPPRGKPLLVPPALLCEFPGISAARVIAELAQLGYDDVRPTDSAEAALLDTVAVAASSRAHERVEPLIAPLCPAVVNLVEVRFPSLLDDVAPFVSPIESAALCTTGEFAVVPACPAQRTALLACDVPAESIFSPHPMRAALLPRLADATPDLGNEFSGESACTETAKRSKGVRILRVTGMREVIRTLEDLEDGLLSGVSVLELYACERGCFGSGMLRDANRALGRHQWRWAPLTPRPASVHPRAIPNAPRSGIRLDIDMTRAMAKLARIDQLAKVLPGRDCGLCGAPTCRAFAEDVVLDRVPARACLFVDWTKVGLS